MNTVDKLTIVRLKTVLPNSTSTFTGTLAKGDRDAFIRACKNDSFIEITWLNKKCYGKVVCYSPQFYSGYHIMLPVFNSKTAVKYMSIPGDGAADSDTYTIH